MNFLRPALALTFLVFSWSIFFPFIALDDAKHIWQNPYVLHFSIENILQFWQAPYYGLYIPIVYNSWSVLALLSQWLQLRDPTTTIAALLFHSTNVLLHIFNVYLSFHLVKVIIVYWQTRSSPNPAVKENQLSLLIALGILPFAIHPLQVESVAWVSGLKDILSTTLGLVTLLSWCSWNFEKPKVSKKKDPLQKKFFWEKAPSITFYGALVLALLTKPSAVVLPFIALVIHLLFAPNQWRQVIRRLWLMVALSAWIVLKTKQSQPDVRLEFTLELIERPLVAASSLGFYIAKFLVPWPLAPDYGLNPVKLLHHDYIIALYAVFASFCTYLTFMLKRKNLLFLLGSTIFVLGYLPTLGLIPFEFQNLSTVADRYFYFLPSIGLGIVLISLLYRLNESHVKRILFLLTFVWSTLSVYQVAQWRNNDSLFQQTLTTNSESYLALNNLGLQAIRAADFATAEKWLKRALEIKPDYLAAVANLGVVYFKQNNFSKAIEFYSQELNKFPPAGAGSPATFADMHFNLGAAYLNSGQISLGQKNLESAVTINPDHFLAHFHLGRVYSNLKNFERARIQFAEALRLQPHDTNVLNELKRLPK